MILDEIRARARDAPTHVAVRDPTGSLTYAELVRSFEARAAEIAPAVSGPGERIGMIAPQGTAFIATALAILDLGGCLVPIPTDQSESALSDFTGRAGLHALVRVGDGIRTERFEPSGFAGEEFSQLDPAYLRFTSGTTNESKGVVISHAAILERLSAANQGMGISAADRVMWLLPMAHHFVVSILLYLRNGATILIPASSLARSVLDLAADAKPTVFYASPYHYGLLAKDASSQRLDSVRLAVSTAEGLRVETADLFRSRFGIALTQALGIIEVGLPVMNLTSAAEKPTALGRALPDYEVWLRDECGQPVESRGSADCCGEVCIRGPGMFDAYLSPWTPSRHVLGPDGFRTGDQGWFDEDGDLHLVGRRANRINMAGMKFFSEEVEEVLDRHPAIARSRVIAREHPHLGQIPIAEIVLSDPDEKPSPRDLTTFCKEHLPAYKVPRQFQVLEDLPTTVTGKVRRT